MDAPSIALTCITGDCGGKLKCGGVGGVPPASLTEFTPALATSITQRSASQQAIQRRPMKADSTLLESSADVSRKKRPSCCAKSLAISTGTARLELRSDLLPTSMTSMLLSACIRSSSNHFSTWSKHNATTQITKKQLTAKHLDEYQFVIHDDRPSKKLNPNGGFRFHVKFVLNKPIQKLRFSNPRVPNHDNLEHVIDALVRITLPLSHSSTNNPFGKPTPLRPFFCAQALCDPRNVVL
ncbi:hypothetical protein CR513_53787, partial [Mucuna pruriens]